MTLTTTDIQNRLPLYKALMEARPHMPTVEKAATATVQTRNGGTYEYSYADLADMDEALRPVLHTHGLLVDFEMHTDDQGKKWLHGLLIHVESGAYKTSEWEITGHTNQDRGGDITYGRRYLTGILTGVLTGKDTDGKPDTGRDTAPTRQRPTQKTAAKLATPEQVARIDALAEAGELPNLRKVLGRQPGKHDITAAEADKVIAAAENQ